MTSTCRHRSPEQRVDLAGRTVEVDAIVGDIGRSAS